jgi:Fur family ferric uptake transcriptional regulator
MEGRMDKNREFNFLKRFKNFLADEKIPLTAQREQILRVAFSIENHFSAEDLAGALRKKYLKIGMATIYRTLGLLVSGGIIREHDFGEGFRRYERIVDRSHHDHLICEDCGGVIEFEAPAIEKLQTEVIDLHRFRARSHKLEIYGLCKDCSNGE